MQPGLPLLPQNGEERCPTIRAQQGKALHPGLQPHGAWLPDDGPHPPAKPSRNNDTVNQALSCAKWGTTVVTVTSSTALYVPEKATVAQKMKALVSSLQPAAGRTGVFQRRAYGLPEAQLQGLPTTRHRNDVMEDGIICHKNRDALETPARGPWLRLLWQDNGRPFPVGLASSTGLWQVQALPASLCPPE